jgi:LysR family transcriptional regulator, hypochlorite-specific transcription factor HypT
MNLSWLEDFLALADNGNFSRAAEQRHMTQPAFSRRIQALESWLGVALFERRSHPVTLTDTGRWFRTAAREILNRVARVPDEARAVADGSLATLQFAATHALSLTFLPAWLRSLESRTLIGPIHLVSDVAANCEALMQEGRVQFMLCHAHPLAPGGLDATNFRSVRVGTDSLLPVCAATRSGKPRHPLPVSGDSRIPLLAYSAESGLGRVVRAVHGNALHKANAEPVFTAHLAALLKSMALDGRGVAWLPRSLIKDDIDEGRLVEAGARRWRIDIEIRLFRRRAADVPTAEAFWQAAGGT